MNPDDAKIKILYHRAQIAELEKKLEAPHALDDIVDTLWEMIDQEADEEIKLVGLKKEIIISLKQGITNYRKLEIEIEYLLL